ncbi:hypothetical protein EV121DRAFT_218520 [Schizophyllum commune]
MTYEFHCKHGNTDHRVIKRARKQTSYGTTQLLRKARECDESRGLQAAVAQTIPYSPLNHRTLIALRSAASHRPFHMVKDKFYEMEVQMLRPATILPSPQTISADLERLYIGLTNDLKKHLIVSPFSVFGCAY